MIEDFFDEFSSENFQITIQQQKKKEKKKKKKKKKVRIQKKERNMASRLGPKFGKVAVHNFPLSYYYKVATASFVCGGIFEAFMIHT